MGAQQRTFLKTIPGGTPAENVRKSRVEIFGGIEEEILLSLGEIPGKTSRKIPKGTPGGKAENHSRGVPRETLKETAVQFEKSREHLYW